MGKAKDSYEVVVQAAHDFHELSNEGKYLAACAAMKEIRNEVRTLRDALFSIALKYAAPHGVEIMSLIDREVFLARLEKNASAPEEPSAPAKEAA